MPTNDRPFRVYEEQELASRLRCYVRPPRGPVLADLVLAARRGMSATIIHLSRAELRAWVRLRGMNISLFEAAFVEYPPLKQVGYYDLLADLPPLPADLPLALQAPLLLAR